MNDISIKDLLYLFLGKIWFLIIALVVGAICAYFYTEYRIPYKYSSHISMYVQTYVDTKKGENSDNDISKSKQLINTYIQVLKDDAVMNSVGKELCNQIDKSIIESNFVIQDGIIKPSSLLSVISISSVTDTSAITISATTKDAELSAAICNELCKQANYFTDKAIGVGEINSIDTAKVYPNPVEPNIVKNTALGSIALFMLVAFIIFLIDFFDNTINGADQLSKISNKAILGEIDKVSNTKRKNDDEHFSLLKQDVPFNVVESCKTMRTNITYALSTSESKAFVVSSSNPGEGKSTTAANLAITMAEDGQKVLLIDGDMRKPVQHKIFTLKNEKGLSSILSKMEKIDDCIQKTDKNKLSLITSGPIPPNPSELLSSTIVEELVNDISEKYDVIIIDSPPINVVSDALNLSQYVAGLLAVVRNGYTINEDVKELINRADMAHMNVLGFVISMIKKKKSGAYYKKYSKYHYYKDYSYEYSEKKSDSNK